MNSLGYNIIGNNDGCSVATGTGDNFGTTASPVDALLAPLALNGGQTEQTKTHALLSGSPALDQIANGANGCGTTYTTDQRGKIRPINSSCDIAAFELQSTDLDCTADYNPTGVSVSATLNGGSDDPGCFYALKRSVFPGLAQTSGEFKIVWVLSTDRTPFDMNLRLCYTAAELTASGVADENTITAYRYDETTSTWVAQATTPDAANNCVDVANVTQFSPWTLAGDGNAPTAVSLQSISATSNAALLPLCDGGN